MAQPARPQAPMRGLWQPSRRPHAMQAQEQRAAAERAAAELVQRERAAAKRSAADPVPVEAVEHRLKFRNPTDSSVDSTGS